MLNKNLVFEFLQKNKIPLFQGKKGEIGCIEHSKDHFQIRFPGGGFGLASLFLSGAHLYGFKINFSGFKKLLPSSPHPKNCFHILNLTKHPEEFFLEKKELEKLEFLTSAKQTKPLKEKAFFIISGPFTLKGKLVVETQEGKEKITALIVNLDQTIEYIKALCKKTLEKKVITLPFDLGLEYLTQTMFDLFQDHLWQSTIKYYKDIPIYKISFSQTGKYKISEFGRI